VTKKKIINLPKKNPKKTKTNGNLNKIKKLTNLLLLKDKNVNL